MGSVGGRAAKVTYGSVLIAGLGEFSFSGFVPVMQEDTAFGDTVKKYMAAGINDPGTVSFSGNYDPTDTTGQTALDVLCAAGTGIPNLYFYITATKYWSVDVGGLIFITKSNAVTMTKNGLGTVSFTGQVSAKPLVLIGT